MRPGAPRRPSQPSSALTAAMAGAVDLAAVKARSEAAARAAEAPAPDAAHAVVAVSEATFQSEVIDRSFQVPVLLDLWAEWCQPCKQLSPILERLAAEGAGSWVLATVDVDANPRISQALQVQGIPAVFAVIGGQVIPGFQGALPEVQVREFIAAVLQAGAEAGLSGAVPGGAVPGADDAAAPAAEPEDPRFDAAEAALADGDYATAAQRFESILEAEPGNAAATLALHQVRLLQRVTQGSPDAVARADADPADIPAQLAAADVAMADDDADAALRRLLEVLPRCGGDERDLVRQRLLEYFDLLGPDDERVGQARREMARALF